LPAGLDNPYEHLRGTYQAAAAVASWAGLCPGQDESAGKRRSGKTRKGNRWLRTALVEAAQAARRTKTYLAAQFRRLTTRRGLKKAMVAVAHSILRIVYHLLIDEHPFEDLGEAYFDQRQRQQISRLSPNTQRRPLANTSKAATEGQVGS
jgi:transposase